MLLKIGERQKNNRVKIILKTWTMPVFFRPVIRLFFQPCFFTSSETAVNAATVNFIFKINGSKPVSFRNYVCLSTMPLFLS
jgi:hypothetical protein